MTNGERTLKANTEVTIINGTRKCGDDRNAYPLSDKRAIMWARVLVI